MNSARHWKSAITISAVALRQFPQLRELLGRERAHGPTADMGTQHHTPGELPCSHMPLPTNDAGGRAWDSGQMTTIGFVETVRTGVEHCEISPPASAEATEQEATASVRLVVSTGSEQPASRERAVRNMEKLVLVMAFSFKEVCRGRVRPGPCFGWLPI